MKICGLLIAGAVMGLAQLVDAGSSTDRNFTGGAVWDRNTPGYEDLGAAPYADLRYGTSFSYRLPVSNGFYRVRAYLMENRSTNIAVGQRVFTIAVNGQASAPVDIYAAVGSKTPYTLDLYAIANGGAITVTLTATRGNAVVSAIEVAPMALTDLDTGAITGDSVRLKSGKYVDVFSDTNADFKKPKAALEPARTVPLAAVVADRQGYTGTMMPMVGNDSRLKTAIFANGSVAMDLQDNPTVLGFGFPAVQFSERLTWATDGRWEFAMRPNPANSLSVYRNGAKLTQDAYALLWASQDQLPDALAIPGSLPEDVILVDYVAGGVPAQ